MQTGPYELSTWPRLLWASLKGIVGTFVGIAGLIAGIAAWFIPATEKIALPVFAVTLLVSLAIIAVLIEAARIAKMHAASTLPRVKLSIVESKDPDEPRVILLLEPSSLYFFGLVVSVFVVEKDQYERFFGQGLVQNIQDDGLIQVRLDDFDFDATDVLNGLKSNSLDVITRLRVKPYVQQRTHS
ncbi:hypothetical protein [Rhodoferax sp.]|uniref:hypothetical protein n=1 Tax=Rhodoferax sp. TaxID=50421 RepID=UPI00284F3666|nr:hypothetical protein [Rhodoferax sp.]MDR3370632.1 hypothetical protein [Rhodoferax sp.]